MTIRSSTFPPGSTFTTSGSAKVRSLARKASYFTSFRSGAAPLALMFMAPPVPDAVAPIPGILEEPPIFIPAMLPDMLELLDEPVSPKFQL